MPAPSGFSGGSATASRFLNRGKSTNFEATNPFESKFEDLRKSFAADVDDLSGEQERLGAGLSSTIAQKFGAVGGSQNRRFSGNLQQLGRKTKARSKIFGRGDTSIRQQQFKNRLSIARQNLARRGKQVSAAGASARLRAGLDTSLRASKDRVNSAVFGAAGGLAGGVARGVFDSKQDRDFRIDQELESSGIFDEEQGLF